MPKFIHNGKVYGGAGASAASNVIYDPTNSKSGTKNVQTSIDDIYSKISTNTNIIGSESLTTNFGDNATITSSLNSLFDSIKTNSDNIKTITETIEANSTSLIDLESDLTNFENISFGTAIKSETELITDTGSQKSLYIKIGSVVVLILFLNQIKFNSGSTIATVIDLIKPISNTIGICKYVSNLDSENKTEKLDTFILNSDGTILESGADNYTESGALCSATVMWIYKAE